MSSPRTSIENIAHLQSIRCSSWLLAAAPGGLLRLLGKVENGNQLDLLPITEASVILALPSYSLKVVEQYVGFKRTQDEYGGSWSMAQFIFATETDDEVRRDRLMAQIIKYNSEDLAAAWAVFDWLRKRCSLERQWNFCRFLPQDGLSNASNATVRTRRYTPPQTKLPSQVFEFAALDWPLLMRLDIAGK
jgi:hypothetical protein